jgi:hypothetical protein
VFYLPLFKQLKLYFMAQFCRFIIQYADIFGVLCMTLKSLLYSFLQQVDTFQRKVLTLCKGNLWLLVPAVMHIINLYYLSVHKLSKWQINFILSTFAKLQEATISFNVCQSICLSGHQHGTTRLPQNRFSLNLIFQ